MTSLETSVTLEDVFNVVEAKRVPLAPELAGYLALEIADGTDAGSGDVEPKTVFISEAGTVALVRPKRDSVHGDAEASIRDLLAKLLDASGSATPALSTAAKRRTGNGLPALVEELEAALIPVNRAAGRRALARLAREVKRVLLGVGRNASVPPVARQDSKAPLSQRHESKAPLSGAPHARPALRKREDDRPSEPKALRLKISETKPPVPEVRQRMSSFDDEAVTAKRTNKLLATPPPPHVTDGPNAKDEAAAPPAAPEPARRDASPASGAHPDAPRASLFAGDEVDSLLDSFGLSSAHEDKQMARELKAMAGLSPTPPPPDAQSLAELTKSVGKDPPKDADADRDRDRDGVEALLALADASAPVSAPPAAPPHVAPRQPAPPAGDASAKRVSGAIPKASAPHRTEEAPPSTSDVPAAGSSAAGDISLKQPAPPRFDPPKPTASGAAPRSRAAEATATTSPPLSTKRSRAMKSGQHPRAPKTGLAMLVLSLVVLAGGTVAVWKFAPQVFAGKKRTLASSAAASLTALAPPAPKCKVALVLTEAPSDTEILLRMGQAPVDVERMPVGTRLELIATAEGYEPRRAVVKEDATWDTGPDGKPRIEVPIQLDPSKAKPGAIDPWPAAEPGSQVGGSGDPGTLHVVSNVRGAEVWLLAGLGPEARIDQLRCDADIDLLLAGPPDVRKRLHVDQKDIAALESDAQGNKTVQVSAR